MRPRRKLLLLIPHSGYGGAQGAMLRLYRYLQNFHDVRLVLFGVPNIDENRTNDDKDWFDAIILDEGLEFRGKMHRWWYMWRTLLSLKNDAEICISFLAGANFLNSMTQGKAKTITSQRGSRRHDTQGSMWNHLLWYRILDYVTYSLSDNIVSISAGLTQEISESCFKKDIKKIVTLESGVDVAALERLADQTPDDDLTFLAGYTTIVCAGRLHIHKGFALFISIFAELKTIVQNAKLLIIGDGSELQSLLKLCNDKGLQAATDSREYLGADVIFAGYRRNPVRNFKLGKIFVLSSLHEGLGNVLIEALASGVPIAASDCPYGPRSVLSDDPSAEVLLPTAREARELKYGLLLPPITLPENRATWVKVLVEALATGRLAPTLTASERRNALARFDIGKVGERWLQLIDETCSRKQSAKEMEVPSMRPSL